LDKKNLGGYMNNTLFNIHKDKRCFILGGGESIKEWTAKGINFKKIIDNEITFGMNKSYKLGGTSTYHVVFDLPYFESDKDNLLALNTHFFFTITITNKHPELEQYSLKPSKVKTMARNTTDNGIYYGRSSGYIALNMAQLMGCNPIYMIGFDLEGGHFHEGYGEAAQKKLPRDHKVIESELRKGIAQIKHRVKIISLSSISKLNDIIEYDPTVLKEYTEVEVN